MLVANISWIKFRNLLFFIVTEYKARSGENSENSLTMLKTPNSVELLTKVFKYDLSG